jgi:hypothetical protein
LGDWQADRCNALECQVSGWRWIDLR